MRNLDTWCLLVYLLLLKLRKAFLLTGRLDNLTLCGYSNAKTNEFKVMFELIAFHDRDSWD